MAGWITAFKVIPWGDLIAAAPTVVKGARQLWATVRKQEAPQVAGRGGQDAQRALGVTGPKRSPGLPDVPAIVETVPGYTTFGWYSIVAPKGIPGAVLAKASAEVVKAAREPAFGERLKVLGIEIIGGGRKELDDFRAAERKRVSDLVKASGISITK